MPQVLHTLVPFFHFIVINFLIEHLLTVHLILILLTHKIIKPLHHVKHKIISQHDGNKDADAHDKALKIT